MAKEDNKQDPKKVTPSKCPPQPSSPRPEDQHAPPPTGSKVTSKDALKQDSKHEKTVRTRLQRRQDQIVASTTSPQILTAESNSSKTSTPPTTSKKIQVIASDTRIEIPETSSSQAPVAPETFVQIKAQKAVDLSLRKFNHLPFNQSLSTPKLLNALKLVKLNPPSSELKS